MTYNLRIGMRAEKAEQVTGKNTARTYGSGSIDVYATPAMIGLMEGANLAAVDPVLPAGMTTVGINVNVRHLAATPVGMTVRATAELIEIAGKRLTFKVVAYDEKEKIGEGTHQRYIVETESFLQNAEAKKK